MFRKLLLASAGLGAIGGSHLTGASRRARSQHAAGPSLGRKLMFTSLGLGVLGCLVLVVR